MKGYVQVYTGDGKGKTSAALGLILRASGAGLRAYLGQFIKRGSYGEIKALQEHFPEVAVEQFGHGEFIKDKPSPEDIKAARDGLEKLRAAMLGGQYDVVIADEIGPAVATGLFPVEDVIQLLDQRPEDVELVLTGRDIHERLIERADLVTDMRNVKHYLDSDVKARKGIEC